MAGRSLSFFYFVGLFCVVPLSEIASSEPKSVYSKIFQFGALKESMPGQDKVYLPTRLWSTTLRLVGCLVPQIVHALRLATVNLVDRSPKDSPLDNHQCAFPAQFHHQNLYFKYFANFCLSHHILFKALCSVQFNRLLCISGQKPNRKNASTKTEK